MIPEIQVRNNRNNWLVIVLVAFMMLTQIGGAFANNTGQQTKDAITAGDLAAQARRAYMQSLVEQGGKTSIRLDLSDEKQYQFVLDHAKAVGKTKDRFPQFFKTLEETRGRHIAEKRSDALIKSSQILQTGGGCIHNKDHVISTITIDETTNKFFVSAFSTVHGGSYYSYVDVVVFDADGVNQLTPLGHGEEFADGVEVVARTSGSLPSGERQRVVTVMSLEKTQNTSDGKTNYHFVSVKAFLTPGIDFKFQIDDPYDADGNDHIVVCLDRNNHYCDYGVIGERYMKVPFKGYLRLPYSITRDNLDPSQTYIKLSGVLASSGEFETIPDVPAPFNVRPILGGTTDLIWNDGSGEQTFCNRISLSPGPSDTTILEWNIPQQDAWFQNEELYRRYSEVNWYLSIGLKNVKLFPDAPYSVNIINAATSDADANMGTSYQDLYPPLAFAYSCVAQGSAIRMADDSVKAVEKVEVGDKIKAGHRTLTVTNLSEGIEQIPMVRITDASGRTLLLTQSHPVMSANSTIKLAGQLKVGDVVETENGPGALVAVSREMFSGNVYGLEVGDENEQTEMAENDNMFFAEGFLVGDLLMQYHYELKKADQEEVLPRLPKRWHKDYLNYLETRSEQ